MDRDCAAVPCTRGYTTDACPTREGDRVSFDGDIARVACTRTTISGNARRKPIQAQRIRTDRDCAAVPCPKGTAADLRPPVRVMVVPVTVISPALPVLGGKPWVRMPP